MTVFIHSPEQGQDGKYSKFYCIKFPVHATNISQEALLGQPWYKLILSVALFLVSGWCTTGAQENNKVHRPECLSF